MKRDCKIGDLSLDEAQILLQIIQNTQSCFSERELRETVIKPLVKITEFGVWSSTLIFFDDEKNYIDSINISNMPEEWVEEYISKNYFRIDPVVNTSLARSNEIHRWEDIYATITSS